MAVFLTLFRLIAYAASPRDFSLAHIALLFGSVSVGGATGGVTYYATDRWRVLGGWRKTAANVVALLAYCFATLAVIGLIYWLTSGGVFSDMRRGA